MMNTCVVREITVQIPCCNPYTINPVQRIVLYKREFHHLSSDRKTVRVLSGVAWITSEANDVILKKGESILLTPNKDGAVISTLRKNPLVLEIEDI